MTKQTKITIASIVFLAIVVIHIYGILANEIVAFISKPLLITSLVILYLVSVKKPNFWFVSALFFSFWGDVLLLFKEQFFVFGLGSFLIAHFLYIKIFTSFLNKTKSKNIAFASLPFLFFLTAFLWILKDHLATMKIPVIVYGITICIFGIVSFLNFLQQKSTANLWLFLGAFSFIISDSLIAINKFLMINESYQIYIMVTYMVAQYLICKAVIAKTIQLES